MAKAKTVFVCTECGYESGKWMGRCSGCGSWNTMVEQQAAAPAAPRPPGRLHGESAAAPVHIKDVTGEKVPHIPTGIAELDRVLGGGYIEGGVLLLGRRARRGEVHPPCCRPVTACPFRGNGCCMYRGRNPSAR